MVIMNEKFRSSLEKFANELDGLLDSFWAPTPYYIKKIKKSKEQALNMMIL